MIFVGEYLMVENNHVSFRNTIEFEDIFVSLDFLKYFYLF